MSTSVVLVQARIEGLSPLIQCRFSEESEQPAPTRSVKIDRGTPRQQAEKVVYRENSSGFYFPQSYLARMLREAGAGHRQQSTRRSVKYIVPAAVIILDVAIPLLEPGSADRIPDFEVDSRPVTIPATKGRIMRHRARFEKWSAEFQLQIDESVLDAATVHQLLEEGGRRIGIGDYRPEKGGPFGRFEVVSWEFVPEGEQPPPPAKRAPRRKRAE